MPINSQHSESTPKSRSLSLPQMYLCNFPRQNYAESILQTKESSRRLTLLLSRKWWNMPQNMLVLLLSVVSSQALHVDLNSLCYSMRLVCPGSLGPISVIG